MFDIVPDLLKAYYISLVIALLVGAVIGVGIVYMWFDRVQKKRLHSLVQQIAQEVEDEEAETDHDAVAKRLIESVFS